MRQSKSSFGIQFLGIELFTQIYAISHVAWNIGTMLLALWTLQKSTCFPMNGFYKGYYCCRTVLYVHNETKQFSAVLPIVYLFTFDFNVLNLPLILTLILLQSPLINVTETNVYR